jgi:hypothetical protein
MNSVLATWECAAIASLQSDESVAFEFAGRMELTAKRRLPFYTVAVTGRSF